MLLFNTFQPISTQKQDHVTTHAQIQIVLHIILLENLKFKTPQVEFKNEALKRQI